MHFSFFTDVLQFNVVTVDGEARIVNQCRNSDLFWALRGGGGGFAVQSIFCYSLSPHLRFLFKVVTSVTYKTHPALSGFVVATLLASTNDNTIVPFLSKILSLQPIFDDIGVASYIYNTAARTRGFIFFPNFDGDINKANATFAPLYELADVYPGEFHISLKFDSYPTFLSLYDNGFATEKAGVSAILGSRLFPRSAFEHDENEKLAKYIANSGLLTLFLLGEFSIFSFFLSFLPWSISSIFAFQWAAEK